MLRGIEDFLWENRFHPIICNVERDIDKVKDYFISLWKNRVAGVIFAPVIDRGYAQNNTKIVTQLENQGVSYVLIDRYVSGFLSNYVVSNQRESSKIITRYLWEKGHRNILLAVGTDCSSMNDGLEGYIDAFKEQGIEPDEKLIVKVNDNLLHYDPDPAEIERMKVAMDRGKPFTAFYALNDRLLKAGITIFLSEGMSIGKEIQLAAHGDVAESFPPYTTYIPRMIQPAYEMGWETAKILLENIKKPGKAVVQMTLKSKFVVGGE